MGMLFIASSTKGFTGLTEISVAKDLDDKEVSPALSKLLAALKEQSKGKPTEIVIGVFGEKQHVFTIELNDLSEIQEILQWTLGRN